jgi:glycosyltransferase involved in cell wall biosynthesis
MKILYIHQYFNKPDMTGGTRSYEFAKRLISNGHKVTFLTSERTLGTRSSGWREEVYEGIKILWLSVPYDNRFGALSRIKAFLSFGIRSALKGRTIPFDIIFATSTPLTIGLPGLFLKFLRRRPMVFEVRDLWPELPIAMNVIKNPVLIWLLRAFEKFIYKSSTSIVALSPGMKDGIVRYGIDPKNVHVIPNLADLERFLPDVKKRINTREELGFKESDIVLGYFGTFGKINDVNFLVHMVDALPHNSSVKLLMCGGGATFNETIQAAKLVDPEGERITILEGVSKEEISDLYRAVDISCSVFLPIPEMEINSANKFFDSLASGKCTLINYGGWQQNLLEEHQAGFRVSSNPILAAQELARFISLDTIELNGQNARSLAEYKYDRDKLASLLVSVLESAARV